MGLKRSALVAKESKTTTIIIFTMATTRVSQVRPENKDPPVGKTGPRGRIKGRVTIWW